jgi:hypothetical protein
MSSNIDDEREDPYREICNDMLRRIEVLEEKVERIPCDHFGFPIDEGYDLDEDDNEIRVDLCRNCGERI